MNILKKEFAPYEESVELKELGFDEPCFGGYDMETLKLWIGYLNDGEQFNREYYYPAPTFSQAFRWFREKHGLHSTITSISQESWQWHITKPGESLGKLYDEDFYTYEEAELTCLRKLIEIVKQNL